MTDGTVDFLCVFQGYEDDDETPTGKWYWHGRSDNGKIVVRGEDHPNYNNALRAAQGSFPHLPVFKVTHDGDRVPVGVHATDRYSEIKAILGIPDSEPIFILRGQDKLAANAVQSYRQEANEILDDAYGDWEDAHDAEMPDEKAPFSEQWMDEIREEVTAFREWAKENPDKMKLPD